MRKTGREPIYTCPNEKICAQAHIRINKCLLNGCFAELESTLKNNKRASFIFFNLIFTFVSLTLISYIYISFIYFEASFGRIAPFPQKQTMTLRMLICNYSPNERVQSKTVINEL